MLELSLVLEGPSQSGTPAAQLHPAGQSAVLEGGGVVADDGSNVELGEVDCEGGNVLDDTTVVNVVGALDKVGLGLGDAVELTAVVVELSSPSQAERSAMMALETLVALASLYSPSPTQP